MTHKPGTPEVPGPAEADALASAFGSVDDWAQFVGTEDATQMLAGLGALGGSQELMEQLAAAVLPRDPRALGLAGAAAPDAATPLTPEERLRQAELRFRSLVENLQCVAFIAGMGQGSSEVYINPYIEQLLGYERDEWLRDPFLWYWRLHPDDREAWNQEFARGLMTGGPWQCDCRFLAADGHAVWVRGQARIVRDDMGRPLFLQGIAFDISAVKLAELQASAQRDEALALVAALPDGLIALGDDGRVTHLNAQARELLGYAAGSASGMAPGEAPSLDAVVAALAPATGQALLALAAQCRQTRAVASMTLEFKGGVHVDGRPVPGGGGRPPSTLLILRPVVR